MDAEPPQISNNVRRLKCKTGRNVPEGLNYVPRQSHHSYLHLNTLNDVKQNVVNYAICFIEKKGNEPGLSGLVLVLSDLKINKTQFRFYLTANVIYVNR